MNNSLILFIVIICVIYLYSKCSENFNEPIKVDVDSISEETLLVYYYDPWCEQCIEFNKEWEKLMTYFSQSTKIILASVDCSKNSYAKDAAQILYYPTLRLTRGSRTIDYPYNRPISFEDIVDFIKSKSI